MSHNIYFIKTKNLNLDNIHKLLETNNLNPKNEAFINKKLMNKIIEELKVLNLKFEIFEGKNEDYFELNFQSYQVSIFNSEIAISIPYWDENLNDGINKEVKQIFNVLITNGFSGFDSQSEKIITEKFKFQTTYTESKIQVDNLNHTNTQSQNGNPLIYIGIGFGILIIGILIWKTIK